MRKKKILIVVGIILAIVLGRFLFSAAKLTPFFWQLLFNKEISLKKTDDNINLLLLGIGGGTHDGPNLTDTIIFASINPVTKKTTLVSIPRDLWVPDLGAKINTAYAFGEEKRKGGGLILAKAVTEKILGQPIDYVVRIDFAGFVKSVDSIGGINVNVERSFDDYAYPIEGKENETCGHTQEEIDKLATSSAELEVFPCRYTHIHFDKGIQNMNGKTALEFVRSRHALGEEGTDFARSKRQEKVITAFKDKIFSLQTLANPLKLMGLYSALSENIDTDVQQSEFDDFIRLAEKMKSGKIQSAVLDFGNQEKNLPGLLANPPIGKDYSNQWVLIPRIGNGNFSEIKNYVGCEIKIGSCPITVLKD